MNLPGGESQGSLSSTEGRSHGKYTFGGSGLGCGSVAERVRPGDRRMGYGGPGPSLSVPVRTQGLRVLISLLNWDIDEWIERQRRTHKTLPPRTGVGGEGDGGRLGDEETYRDAPRGV